MYFILHDEINLIVQEINRKVYLKI